MQIVQPAVVQYFSNNNCLKIDDGEAAKVSLFYADCFIPIVTPVLTLHLEANPAVTPEFPLRNLESRESILR